MAFYINEHNTTYCKIWDIKPSEKYTDVRISTSEKDRREEGKYINSSWFGRCVGEAHNQIKKMKVSDSAKIVSAKISNESYKKDDQTKSVLRVTIFKLEPVSPINAQPTEKPAKKSTTAKKSDKPMTEEEIITSMNGIASTDELPF